MANRGRPKGSGGKKVSDAEKIRRVLLAKGLDYPTKKVAGIVRTRGVVVNTALSVKISIERGKLRKAA